MNPKVDFFFDKESKWQKEYARLRHIILDTQLAEDLKWGCPCYAYKNNNIVLIHGFKDYCALLFFKGALLQDGSGILVQQTENVQASRQIRFSGMDEILELEPIVKAYVYEAIEVERAGLKVQFKKTREFPMPDEFRDKLDTLPALKDAFEALTPGRQRAYLLHFSQAKQSKTRLSRIEKWIPQILKGKGISD